MTPRGDDTEKSLGEIVSEASEKASLLVREEIELAKAEVVSKAKTMGRGAGVAAAAGVFLIFAVVIFLEGLAWFFVDLFDSSVWVGFLIVFAILVALAVIAGLLAKKWLSAGPPKPDMAIEEAKLTRETLSESREGPNPLPAPTPGAQEAPKP